jgi:hypothetical protein
MPLRNPQSLPLGFGHVPNNTQMISSVIGVAALWFFDFH